MRSANLGTVRGTRHALSTGPPLLVMRSAVSGLPDTHGLCGKAGHLSNAWLLHHWKGPSCNKAWLSLQRPQLSCSTLAVGIC